MPHAGIVQTLFTISIINEYTYIQGFNNSFVEWANMWHGPVTWPVMHVSLSVDGRRKRSNAREQTEEERGRQRGRGEKVVHSTLPGSVCLPEQHSPIAQPRKRRRRRKKRDEEKVKDAGTLERENSQEIKAEIQDKGRDRITGWAVYWNRYRDANKRHLKCFIEEIIENRLDNVAS